MKTFENFADFLDARYNEDETDIREAHTLLGPTADHHVNRALDDLQAKRTIVELHRGTLNRHTVGRTVLGILLEPLWVCQTCSAENGDGYNGQVLAPCPTLQALAIPYTNHPDMQRLIPNHHDEG